MNILPFLVIGAAILAFFLDEFTSLFRKIFAHAWVRLLLPLTIASMIVAMSKSLNQWVLPMMQSFIHRMMLSFFKLFPFAEWSAIVSLSIFLFLASGLPVWGLYWWLKRKEAPGIDTTIICFYAFIWLFLSLLWVV